LSISRDAASLEVVGIDDQHPRLCGITVNGGITQQFAGKHTGHSQAAVDYQQLR
jgi:hypothetical protein